jgi:type I restriction enzyme M protein
MATLGPKNGRTFSLCTRRPNATVHAGNRRTTGKADYQARGVMYLPPQARFSYLLRLPESDNIGKTINEAMKAVEAGNEELRGVLPTNYTQLNLVG